MKYFSSPEVNFFTDVSGMRAKAIEKPFILISII